MLRIVLFCAVIEILAAHAYAFLLAGLRTCPQRHSSRSRGDYNSRRSVACGSNSRSYHRVVLIRHGESTWNRDQRYIGWTGVYSLQCRAGPGLDVLHTYPTKEYNVMSLSVL